MPNNSEHSLAIYSAFLKSANRNLGPRNKMGRSKWIAGIPVQAQGLENLLNSFYTGSPNDKVKDIEEWNPFSQRPIYILPRRYPRTLYSEFESIADAANRLVVMAHEAMHVLLWEPFFCGHFIPSKRNFRHLSLGFEGFCFWYADIIVNGKIRLEYPDGERALERCSASQQSVHPRTAFELLEIKDPRKTMEIYVAAFLGYETYFTQHLENPIIRNLAERFYSFYSLTVDAPNGMFQSFKEFGLLDDFYIRFCKPRGLPSILPDAVLSRSPALNLEDYCWTVYNDGLKHIETLDRRSIKSVRVRRGIQTRAYFAYSLRNTIRKHQYKAKTPLPRNSIVPRIDEYLDLLSAALTKISRDHEQAELAMHAADHFYTRQILGPLKIHEVHATARAQLAPQLRGHSKLVLHEHREHFSSANISHFSRSVMDMYVRPALDFEREGKKSKELTGLMMDTLDSLTQLKRIRNEDKRTEIKASVSKKIDQMLGHELVFKRWSLPLSANDPAANIFHEINFIYK